MTATMATTAAPIGLYEHLKDDLGYLKLTRAAEILPGLLDRARAEQLTHAQFLAELLAEEAAATRNRKLAARLRFARFPARRTLAEVDFDFQPSIDRKLVDDLASLRFVSQGTPVLLLGQPGCGKTHLAIALATAAVEAGYHGDFTSAPRPRPAPAATSPRPPTCARPSRVPMPTAPSPPRSAPTPGRACWWSTTSGSP